MGLCGRTHDYCFVIRMPTHDCFFVVHICPSGKPFPKQVDKVAEKILEFSGVLKSSGSPEALSDGEAGTLSALVTLLNDVGHYHVSTLSPAMVSVRRLHIAVFVGV